jgi:hypothetical protein
MTKCTDFDEILRRGGREERAALEAHAATCEGCRVQLELDLAISAAAPALHREWDSPALWPRIREAIAAEPRRAPWWSLDGIGELFAVNWRPAVVTAAVAVLAVVGTWYAMRRVEPPVQVNIPAQRERLFTEQALREAEAAESAYVQSIEKLASLAEGRLARADSPLMISYREKLLVLNAAIHELRQQAESNRFNAHLRTELSSLYREKQRTLELVLQEN